MSGSKGLHDLATPALWIDADALDHNLRAMSAALPGSRLRPHVKAHKSSRLARRQAAAGHPGFTCATAREVIGLARAGLGEDLLLANELLDPERLRALARLDARVTVAVDSPETIEAAADAGIAEVLIDVNVGLPRCGCPPEHAGMLGDRARRSGMQVRGVMGYEGHIVGIPDREQREQGCRDSMDLLATAHQAVGGDVISAGGTGTFDCNGLATEIQAGSYALMDTAYGKCGMPFRQALFIESTIISVSSDYAVADCGLKALGMDHGAPDVDGGTVWFCSDEHITFAPDRALHVGDRVRIVPAHVDPTVAYHESIHVVSGTEIVETWEIDLRGW